MTNIEITEATAFITHKGLRAIVAANLSTGVSFVCPDCGQIADMEAGCAPCDDIRFAAQAAEYEALMMNAETSTGCDPYAIY